MEAEEMGNKEAARCTAFGRRITHLNPLFPSDLFLMQPVEQHYEKNSFILGKSELVSKIR